MVLIEIRKKEISFEEIYEAIHKHFQEYGFDFSGFNFPLLQVGVKNKKYSEIIFSGEYVYDIEILKKGLTIISFNQKFTDIAKLLEYKLIEFDFKIIIEEDF